MMHFQHSSGIKQAYIWVIVSTCAISSWGSYCAGLSKKEDWQSIGPDHAIHSDWEVCPGQAAELQHGVVLDLLNADA